MNCRSMDKDMTIIMKRRETFIDDLIALRNMQTMIP